MINKDFIWGMLAAGVAVLLALLLIWGVLGVFKLMTTPDKSTDTTSKAACTVQSVNFDERSVKLTGKQANGKPCANTLLYDAKTVVQVGTTKTNPSALAAAKSITYDLPKGTAKDPPTGTANDPATTPAAKITITTGGTPQLTLGKFEIGPFVNAVATPVPGDDQFSTVKGDLDFQGNIETWKTIQTFDVGDCRILTQGLKCTFFASDNLSNELFKTVNSALQIPALSNVKSITTKTGRAPDGSTQEVFDATPKRPKAPSTKITVTLSPSQLLVAVTP